jgi:hypothetical protein
VGDEVDTTSSDELDEEKVVALDTTGFVDWHWLKAMALKAKALVGWC